MAGRPHLGFERREATPLEIAKFGHIAVRLRALLDTGEWTIPQLSAAAGCTGRYAAWPWVYARAAPNTAARTKLAKAIGCRPSDLERNDSESPRDTAEPDEKPARTERETAPVPVFSFAVMSDGNARVKLDTTLPLESAKPLIRLLFDAGDLLPGGVDSLQARIGPPSRR